MHTLLRGKKCRFEHPSRPGYRRRCGRSSSLRCDGSRSRAVAPEELPVPELRLKANICQAGGSSPEICHRLNHAAGDSPGTVKSLLRPCCPR